MLLRAIFLCVAISALCETMLQAAAALAVASLHRQGVVAVTNAFADGAQRAQSAIAAAVAQGAALPTILPSPAPTCVLAGATGCALVAQESIALATPQPTACPSSGCAGYAQEDDAVSEGRVVASIVAKAWNASGEIVATRNESIVFRTLRVAPYALPAGSIDATLDDAESGPGDAGGIVPGAVSNGTLIDTVYQNAASGALMPANVWSPLAPTAQLSTSWSP